jgi:hypothetical protein
LNICGKLSHPGIKRIKKSGKFNKERRSCHSSTGQALPYTVTTE